MHIEKVYLKFLQKVNKNLTNDNISVDKGRFIYIINEAQNNYIQWVLDKRNEEELRYLQQVLVDDKVLVKNQDHGTHDDFDLPSDYFDLSSVTSYAKSGNCGNAEMFTYEIKDENRAFHRIDTSLKPSFKDRETFYFLSDKKVKVFKDDFSIEKVTMSYYRYPVQMDISGYIKEDGTTGSDINPEFDDKVVDKIISIAAKEFDLNNDGEKFNTTNQRIVSRF